MGPMFSRTARNLKRGIARAWRRTGRGVRRAGNASGRSPQSGPDPANLVWIFGSARTGSTWLGAMMADVKGHTWWHEPMVGYLFGHLYFDRARARRKDDHFVLGGERELWLGPVRRFVLDSVETRFPGIGGDRYLVVKEPHGTLGAPVLLQALPESRMILLVRDPRDVISSKMDAAREGSWAEQAQKSRGQRKANASADESPDAFVKSQAKRYARLMDLAQQAFEAHEGPKTLVRYEDLLADPLGTMRRLYSEIGIPAGEGDLARVVERHAWKNIPEREKGKGKFYRKGSPGGWSEDLTPGQVEIVEGLTASVLDRYYAGERRSPR